MTSPRTRPIDVIRQFQNLLREGYKSGFPILKELLQNADDAGAKRWALHAHRGFADAINPLLQAPSLIVLNNGPVLDEHFEAMLNASGGSKGGDASTVGRFGLGQKAVYHLCDAFVARASLADRDAVRHDVINPWEEVDGATEAGGAWKDVAASDAGLLDSWASAQGFGSKGMMLVLPLRSEKLTPGGKFSLKPDFWVPDAAIEDLLRSPDFTPALACLRSLEVIEIVAEAGTRRRIEIQAKTGRLSKAIPHAGLQSIGGTVLDGTAAIAAYLGREIWVPVGNATTVKGDPDWPTSWDVGHNSVKTEAEPHGAVVLCQSPVSDGGDVLRLHWTVYLPVGEAIEAIDLPPGLGAIDLMLHGYCFVTSDRTSIVGLNDETTVEARWNRALLAEATLPLLLDVLADVMPDLGGDQAAHAVISALRRTRWWSTYADHVCGERALAFSWTGSGPATWRVNQSDTLRPIPRGDATVLKRLTDALPGLATWCIERRIKLNFGSTLSTNQPQWSDAELAALIELAGGSVFTKNRVAETIATMLESATSVASTQVGQALADSYQGVTRGSIDYAGDEQMRRLVRFVPTELLLPLPSSVEHRGLMAALATASPMLPVRATWHEGQPKLDLTQTIDLLAAMEPFIEQKGVGKQARTMVSRLLDLGPSLATLAANDRARQLRIMPATRMLDKKEEILTLAKATQLSEDHLLFSAFPKPKWLDVLAAAIIKPAVYRMSGSDEEGAFRLARTTEESLEQVLRGAERFGEPEDRAALLKIVIDTAPVDDLRKLAAGDSNLPTNAELIEMGSLPEVLSPLAGELSHGKCLIDGSVAQKLDKTQKRKLRITDVNITELGHWLAETQRAQTLAPLSEPQAIALLTHVTDHSLLRALPVHRTTRGGMMAADETLWLANRNDVPDTLMGDAQLVELWPDNDAQRVQREIIRRWNPVAQIETALSTSDPSLHMAEIVAALENSGADIAAVTGRLKTLAWIRTGGRAIKTTDVLDLPVGLDRVFHEVIGDKSELVSLNGIATLASSEAVVGTLRKFSILQGRRESLELAALSAADVGIAGVAFEMSAHDEDARTLAQQSVDLGPGWRLVKAALIDNCSSEDVAALDSNLQRPSRDDVVMQLNKLARVTDTARSTEAARRLHLAAFKQHSRLLVQGGFLPAELLVLSNTGEFSRADQLARSANVAPGNAVESDYAGMLGSRDSDPIPTVAKQASGSTTANDFAAALGAHLDRWRDWLPEGGALFVMALLGRDQSMMKQASEWPGTQSFARICEEIDGALTDQSAIAYRLSRVRFTLAGVLGGEVRVLSAAGTMINLPKSSNPSTWLIDTRRELPDDGSTATEQIELVMSDQLPTSERQVPDLLRDLVRGLLPCLQLQYHDRGAGILTLLETLFEQDMVTLDDTREELREVIHDRLRGLRVEGRIKVALQSYHDAPKGRRKQAHDALWKYVQSADAASDLLAAVRRNILKMGYAEGRVLFELFQNANDALAFAPFRDEAARRARRFRVEALRGSDGNISRLRVIHWGRPINTPGMGPEPAPGYGRDLANMIAIGHSEKIDERQTGRFGLGFKTVHMLSDCPGVASGPRLATRISGGMVPLTWPEGPDEVRPHSTRAEKATLIDLPIAAQCADAANKGWDSFVDAAPWLTILAPYLGTIITLDSDNLEKTYSFDPTEIAVGVDLIEIANGQRVFRLGLGADFKMLLPLGRHGPYSFSPDIRQFWRLVPLEGIERQGAWLLEGHFDVDPGRTHFSGDTHDANHLFEKLAPDLGAALVALYDAIDSDWVGFAERQGLESDSRDTFWVTLTRLFSLDLKEGAPARGLHRRGGGLSYLVEHRPLVPLALGGFATAGAIKWQLAGAIADDAALLKKVAGWFGLTPLAPTLVSREQAERLVSLGFDAAIPRFDLLALLSRMISDRIVSPDLASIIGQVIDSDATRRLPWDEQEGIRAFFRDCLFQAEDGTNQPIRHLGFLSGEAGEVAFAPAAGRLSAEYEGPALDFATVAREQAGGVDDVRRRWAASANESVDRTAAFLRCLAHSDHGRAKTLASAAPWLPKGAELASSPLLDLLSVQDRAMLLARLHVDPEAYEDELDDDPIVSPSRHSPNPTIALELIAEWWDQNGDLANERYHHATYPEGFSPSALASGGDEQWFTMLSLATFHTIGRIKPEASRGFIMDAIKDDWWRDLANVRHTEDLEPFTKRLREWSEPWNEPRYGQWRRSLVDLCMVARYVDQYARLFRSLPGAVATGKLSLRTYLTPAISQHAADMAIEAAPLAPSLGIGANWMIRELCRYGVFCEEQARTVAPHGWGTPARVRRLFGDLGLGAFAHGIDQGVALQQVVVDYIGVKRAWFDGAGDLPFHLLTTSKYRSDLADILAQSCGRSWEAYDYDEDDNNV